MDAISKKKSNKRASPYDNDLIGFCCQGDWIGNNVQLSNLDMQANERFLSCTPPFPLSPVISLAHSQLQSVFSFLVFSSVKTPRRLKTTSIPVHRNHSKWKNVWNANFNQSNKEIQVYSCLQRWFVCGKNYIVVNAGSKYENCWSKTLVVH